MVTDTPSAAAPLPHPPRRLPLIGDVVGVSIKTPVQDSIRVASSLGPIFERVVLGRRFVLVTGSALVEELCDETRFAKFLAPAVENLRTIGGDGLFTAYSDEPNWRTAHDLLRPAFTQSAMRSYHDIMLSVAGDLVRHWSRGGTFDVSSDMTKLTLETIGRTGFSYSFDSFDRDRTHPFVEAMVRALTYNQRTALLVGSRPAKLLMRRRIRQNESDTRYMSELIDDIVRARRDGDTAGQGDLLDIMLEAARSNDPNALDEVNIRHQILTFLIAGHETTSGALSFALFYLSRDPELWARARAEVDTVWGADTPTFEQVGKLRLVRRILDEALRLWPTAPGFARQAREDTVIGGRHRMRSGDWAIVFIPGLHRDSVWGEDSDTFDPDRFLSPNVRQRPAHAYKPWGTGERACIGRQFAVHEAVLVLGTLLQKFDVTADPSYDLVVEERLTLMPKNFRLTVSHRRD